MESAIRVLSWKETLSVEKNGTGYLTLTNVYEKDLGKLEVTKIVIGAPAGSESKVYRIAVVTVSGGVTTYYKPNGEAGTEAYWAELKDRETASWYDLPVTTYTVIEDKQGAEINGQTLIVSGDNVEVAVVKNDTAHVTVVNNYTEDEVVSSDVVGITAAALFDATQTMVIPINDELSEVQIISWYDNEYSYTSQMVRTIKYFAELK